MYYAVSDIHGRYDKYKALLDNIGLSDDDTLFVLGDVIDRGKDGLKILLDMSEKKNITILMGNHEAAALVCLPLLIKLAESRLSSDETEALKDWFADGGNTTASEFLALSNDNKLKILDILCRLPAYKEIVTGEEKFILVHAGLGNFSPEKKLSEYSLEELIFERPDIGREYYPDKYIVFGHTPTCILRAGASDAPADNYNVYLNGKLIGIDCGNNTLGYICLDTRECYYF